jgi:hypothetical protein
VSQAKPTLTWAQHYAQLRHGPYSCPRCGPILRHREPFVAKVGGRRCPNEGCDRRVTLRDKRRPLPLAGPPRPRSPSWSWSQPELLVQDVFQRLLDGLEAEARPGSNLARLQEALREGRWGSDPPSKLFANALKDEVDTLARREEGRLQPALSTVSLDTTLEWVTGDSDARAPRARAPHYALESVEILAREGRASYARIQEAHAALVAAGREVPPLEPSDRLIKLIRRSFRKHLEILDTEWCATLVRELAGPFSRALCSCPHKGPVVGPEPCPSCGVQPGGDHVLVHYDHLRGCGGRTGATSRLLPRAVRRALPASLRPLARLPLVFGLLRLALTPLPSDVARFSRSLREGEVLQALLFDFGRTDLDGRGHAALTQDYVLLIARRAAQPGPAAEPALVSAPTAAALLHELVSPFVIRTLARCTLSDPSPALG